MSSMSEIRQRIKVVGETGKITKAMYLISSSKMKKAMQRYATNLVYFKRVRSDIRYILEHTSHKVTHPFLRKREVKHTGYLVIAADKGLCGGYNTNVLNLAWDHMQNRPGSSVFTIGQMTREFFNRKNMASDVEYLHIIQNPNLDNARAVTMELCELYLQNLLDEVFVVYTKLESITKQTPQVMRLLPILVEDFADVEVIQSQDIRLFYHPSPSDVFEKLVPQYLIGLAYGTLVQSYASEQCARMTAMDASTRNSNEMLQNLQIDFNRARQASITQEISEIISGADAMGVNKKTGKTGDELHANLNIT